MYQGYGEEGCVTYVLESQLGNISCAHAPLSPVCDGVLLRHDSTGISVVLRMEMS